MEKDNIDQITNLNNRIKLLTEENNRLYTKLKTANRKNSRLRKLVNSENIPDKNDTSREDENISDNWENI